jgi:hypothetical protein
VVIAATTHNWFGNFELLYFFEGYQYSGTTSIALSGYESDGWTEVQLGTATAPSVSYEITDADLLGIMGVGVDGTAVSCEPPIAVCCYPDDSCNLVDLNMCNAQGGVFYPELETCADDPCDVAVDLQSWGRIKTFYRSEVK